MIEININKFLTFFSISGVLTLLLSLSSGIFVLSRNPTHPVYRSWFLFCISVALWGLGVMFIPTATNPNDAIFWWKIGHIGAINIPTLFLHLSCHFLNLRKKNLLIFSYLLSGIFCALLLTDFFITNPVWTFDSFYYNNRPPSATYKIFTTFWFAGVIYSHYLLYLNLKNSSQKIRTQIRYFLFAFFVSYAGGATCFFPIYGINIYPYGNLLTPFYPLLIGYAIVKHKLMDIHIVIRKSLVYSLLLALITLTYLLLVIGSEYVIQQFWGYESKTISIIVAFGLGVFIIPLRNRIQYVVDKLIFRRSQTEIAEENEKLRQVITRTERLRTAATLASGMAHEIKNPLTAIKTVSEYLPRKIHDPAFIEKYIPLLQKEVDRIDDLVHQLLEYAKPTPPVMKPTLIVSLINETLDLLNQQLISKHINLIKNMDVPSDFEVLIDKNQIKQALLNIILNAIDALPKSGQLYIEVILDRHLYITISDNGPGMTKKDLKNIFDPFYSQKDNGTGLGLSITHEIIQQHQGKIEVQSRLGEGTTFKIKLPVQEKNKDEQETT